MLIWYIYETRFNKSGLYYTLNILRNNVCMEMTNNYFLIGKNIEHFSFNIVTKHRKSIKIKNHIIQIIIQSNYCTLRKVKAHLRE